MTGVVYWGLGEVGGGEWWWGGGTKVRVKNKM